MQKIIFLGRLVWQPFAGWIQVRGDGRQEEPLGGMVQAVMWGFGKQHRRMGLWQVCRHPAVPARLVKEWTCELQEFRVGQDGNGGSGRGQVPREGVRRAS